MQRGDLHLQMFPFGKSTFLDLVVIAYHDLFGTTSLSISFIDMSRKYIAGAWWCLFRWRRKWTPSFLAKFDRCFFRNLWKLQQRYHVMDTDFWRVRVGKVPRCSYYFHFLCFFSNLFRIPKSFRGSHRVPHSLYLFEFDRRRRSCMASKHPFECESWP